MSYVTYAGRAILGSIAIFLVAISPVSAGRSFLDSDDYRQGKAIVALLLTDDDYAKIAPDVFHLDDKLDWAWVVGQGDPQKLDTLGFSVDYYASIVIQLPVDHTAEGGDWLPERTLEALMVHCMRVGWTPAEKGDPVLATAIVDVSDADGFGSADNFLFRLAAALDPEGSSAPRP